MAANAALGKTIAETLKEGTALLTLNIEKKAAIETPSLDAALLLAEILKTDRAGLIIKSREPISSRHYDEYQKSLARRLGGECVAYITGRKEFYGLDFMVNNSVLVPRPETELLVEAALEALKGMKHFQNSAASPKTEMPLTGLKVLDLCTGSGAVAIALKHEAPALDVLAADISPAALETARQNSARLCPHPVNFVQSDLFSEVTGKFHLITANPPYVASDEIDGLAPEVRGEPRLALDGGADGLDLVRGIIREAPRFLYFGGVLALEVGPEQIPAVIALLGESGFRGRKVFRDLAGRDRIVRAVFA